MSPPSPERPIPNEKADHRALSAEPGSILAGKYRIEYLLGRGGMGQVFMATHIQLNEPVAIKLLHKNRIDSPENLDRFLQEARASAKIKSEHIARVLDLGLLEDGSPYMAMEYLEGRDLSKILKKDGPFQITRAIDCILQAAEALSQAHAMGIIHRDLKPSNLFLTQRPDGTPWIKVLDFGISKFIHAGHSHTQTSDILGSPPYMSPEQIRSTKHVDQRSDIWSLGTILFELLTGRTPFQADTMADLCMKIVADPAPPLCSVLPSAPPGLEAILLRCHEKEPSARYASVNELADALRPFALSKQRTLAAGPIMESLRKSGAAAKTQIAAPLELLPSAPPSKKTWLIPTIALGAILALGLISFFAWRASNADEQSSAEAPPIALPAAASITELAPLENEAPSSPPLPMASQKPSSKSSKSLPAQGTKKPVSTSAVVGGGLFDDRK